MRGEAGREEDIVMEDGGGLRRRVKYAIGQEMNERELKNMWHKGCV